MPLFTRSADSSPLQAGQLAPSFAIADVNGNNITLDLNASKYLLIAFLRYAGCPWCNLAIHRLTLEQRLLQESGCSVIAFIQSSKDNIMTSIYGRHKQAPNFPVIADQTMKIYHKYCVSPSIVKTAGMLKQIPHWVHAVRKEGFTNGTVDGSLFLAPAVFLLSPRDRTIIRADYSADLYKHETFGNIYETIAYHKINPELPDPV